MAAPTSYCEAVLTMEPDSPHRHYHDNEYGFPIHDDNALFERLVLEINQAGLNWLTILKKKNNFNKAFDGFDIDKVSKYKSKQIKRLMNDEGIIRNRLKIEATIENANRIQSIQKEFGSFKEWLDEHYPKTREEWTKLFKTTFKFTGGEIVNEFLLSTGYLPGAHIEKCSVYKKVLRLKPAWVRKK